MTNRKTKMEIVRKRKVPSKMDTQMKKRVQRNPNRRKAIKSLICRKRKNKSKAR
jgi:hypothetical protein